MSANVRLIVVLNVDISSNSFLLGQDMFASNGDKTLYVNTVVSMTGENDLRYSPTSWKNVCNGMTASTDGLKLLALAIKVSEIYDGELVESLKHMFGSSSFIGVALPNHGSCRKSMLLIPRHKIPSSKSTGKQSVDVHCNEVMVVYLRRNVKLSVVSLPCWNNSDNKQTKKEVMSELQQKFNLPNGLLTKESVHNEIDKTRTSSALELLSLLLFSTLWFIKWITGLSFALHVQYFLAYTGNFFFVAKQLLYRLNKISDIVVWKENSEKAKLNESSVSVGNQTLSIFIDVFLGLIVVYLVFSNQDFLSISTWIIGQKYTVAEHLKSLLNWLMGVPAGLKLNKPLDQFLGNFYIYHVHLWTSYLYFIEAYLPTIILICTLSGCLGITFLLSVLCDVFSLLTLHIYCFYIYAARLYSLEIHALASLLRLFTGKKWNILRSRVDSMESDVDRLFIGTLLFTILLFLFPTIFLYYIVFTCLRLLVLLIQAVLFGLVALFNTFPFFAIWLKFMNPECLPGRIILDTTTLDTTDAFPDFDNCNGVYFVQPEFALFLSLRHRCSPLRNYFKDCVNAIIEDTYYGIFGGEIFKKLLTGQLINSKNKS